MSRSVAFLISEEYQSILNKYPQFLDEFKVLQPIFAAHGVELVKKSWHDYATIDWKSFAAIIPKACWDYVYHPAKFELFLEHIADLNIPFTNDVDLLRWNMRKTYLQSLAKHNLSVPDFLLIPQHSQDQVALLSKQIHAAGWNADVLVAKPSIGMGSLDTIRFGINDVHLHEKLFSHILSYADLIIQPFFSEIPATGEYSYLFFNNQFSHAVVKKPAVNDYRAHLIYGAEIMPHVPDQEEIKQASSFVSVLSPTPQYARVDVFKRGQELFLIELELIEPYLYLEHVSSETLNTFCQSICLKYVI